MASLRAREPLALDAVPLSPQTIKRSQTSQAIEIAVSSDININELFNAIRTADTAQVTLGKKPAIILDNKTRHTIEVMEKDICFLYKRPSRSNNLNLHGAYARKDAASKVAGSSSQDIDMNDTALRDLMGSLAQHAQQKQANQTIFHNAVKPVPTRGKKQSLNSSKLDFLKKNHRSLLVGPKTTTQSLPASPSLGGVTPNSGESALKRAKELAHKTPFIHLLAFQPHTKQEILAKLKCDSTALEDLLDKYGKTDGSKYTITDRTYKDLDVWKFPYIDQAERQSAIDRAVNAYDRQRITFNDNLWQMLLPKEERGKGTVLSNLSKLKFHQGPIPEYHSRPFEQARTPQIHVEPSTKTAAAKSKVDETEASRGRLDPNSAKASARSSSQDPIKKQRISEKEAQSKRLFAKDPKKAAQAAKVKEAKPASSTMAKAPAGKKSAPAKSANASKIKSQEIIEDSDEDVDMVDLLPAEPEKPLPKQASPVRAQPKPTVSQSNSTKKTSAPKVSTPKAAPAKQVKTDLKPTPLPTQNVTKKDVASVSSDTKNKAVDSGQKSLSMTRTFSHKRSNSSPHKPSPLGSSPPTNASDMDNEQSSRSSKSSSSSNSPLINQAVARKAPARSTPIDNTDRSLKRKANDLDADIHRHDTATNKPQLDRPAKRQQTSSISSGSDRTGSPSPILSEQTIKDSQNFLRHWEQYQKGLKDIKSTKNPPREQVERLHRLRKKLYEHKKQIWNLTA